MSPNKFVKQQRVMLESGLYHDIVLRCSDRQFRLHQNVVCLSSPFMEELCASAAKFNGVVHTFLPDTDTIALEKALEYLYTGTYDHSYEHKFSNAIREEDRMNHLSGTPSIDCTASLIDIDTSLDQLHPPSCSLRSYSGLLTYDAAPFKELHLNVRVYVISTFMDNQELKTEALQRCKTILNEDCMLRVDDVRALQIMAEVLQNTDHNDNGLRLAFVDACLPMLRGKEVWEDLITVLMEHEPIALHLTRNMQQPAAFVPGKSAAKICKLQLDLLESQARVSDLQAALGLREGNQPCNADEVDAELRDTIEDKNSQIKELEDLLASAQLVINSTPTTQSNEKASAKSKEAIKVKDAEIKTLRKEVSEVSKKLNQTEKDLSNKSSELVKMRNEKNDLPKRNCVSIRDLTYEWDKCKGKTCEARFDAYVTFEGDG